MARPMGVFKVSNDYARALGPTYDQTPKAVFAAVAYSFVSAGGNLTTDQARARFAREWRILHENGIVPQAPPKPLLDLIAKNLDEDGEAT